MSEHIAHTTDSDFDADVLQSEQPVLIDFWAEWCGPCKMIAPILDDLAGEYSGRLAIKKLNIDENQGVAQKFGVRSIPRLILFKDGAAQGQVVGLTSKKNLTEFLDSNL